MRASKCVEHFLCKYTGSGSLGVAVAEQPDSRGCRILDRPQQKRVQVERLVTV